jgi:sugar O-acyltransferase (sialic acid O-acetyltransferase NeuD family)
MANSIVLVGGGGHCKSCIDVIESTDKQIAGFIDKNSDSTISGYNYLGNDTKIDELIKSNHEFIITIGFIKTAQPRIILYNLIHDLGGQFATVISKFALVSRLSSIGQGSIVMHHALVNIEAQIGNNCIINNKCLVEHNSIVGDHSHISTGAVVNGDCVVGKSVFIGSNTVVAQGVHIADNVIIGAGSVVVKNITEPGIYIGNPAKKMNHGE